MNKPFMPLSREEIAIRALGLRRDPLAGELIALEPRMVKGSRSKLVKNLLVLILQTSLRNYDMPNFNST